MLLRHFIHQQMEDASIALLGQLAMAKDAVERHRLIYEALQNAALTGYEVRDKVARDAKGLPPVE